MTIQFVSVVQILRIFADSITREDRIAEWSKAARRSKRPFPKRHGPLGLPWPNNRGPSRARGPAVSIRERLRMYADRLIERDVQPNLLS